MHGSQPAGGAETAALLARLAAAFASYQRALPALVEIADLQRRDGESTEDWRARVLQHLSRHERELAALEQMLVRAADGAWRAARPLLDASPDVLARMAGSDPAIALTRDLWALWWRAAGFPDGTGVVARWHDGARHLRRLTLSLLVLARLGRRFARDALSRFAAEVAVPGAGASDPERLHERWIDACESAYAALVFTPRYSRAFGRVVNAAVGTRVATAASLEPLLAAVGVPTRAEFARIVEAQHALAESMKAMQPAASPPPAATTVQTRAGSGRRGAGKRGTPSGSAKPRKPEKTAKTAKTGKTVKPARGRAAAPAWDIATLGIPARGE